MKLDDKNIDQLVRDAAQNASAPKYDSAYWNDVSSLLNAEDRKKKALFFWSIGGSVIVIALFSILFFDGSGQSILYAQVNSENISPIIYSEHPIKPSPCVTSEYVSSGFNSSRSEKEKLNIYNATDFTSLENQGKAINTIGDFKSGKLEDAQAHQDELENIPSNIDVQKDIISENNKNEHVSADLQGISQTLEARNLDFKIPNTPDMHNSITQSHLSLTMELNAGIMENYKTSRPFESGMISFALKGNYIKSNLMFSSGIGLQVATNSDLVVSQRAKFYGFGVVNYQTDLSYQNMYDVYIPLEIGYKQNKTSFGMGLQANYLINTSMSMQKYEDNELVSSENISGYSNGLNKLSALGYVWLSQELGEHFSAGLRIGTNFTNRIKEGDYFNESATTNPVFGQVSLRYRIFK